MNPSRFYSTVILGVLLIFFTYFDTLMWNSTTFYTLPYRGKKVGVKISQGKISPWKYFVTLPKIQSQLELAGREFLSGEIIVTFSDFFLISDKVPQVTPKYENWSFQTKSVNRINHKPCKSKVVISFHLHQAIVF